MISRSADADKPLSALTQRHIDNCKQCREFNELCLSLGQVLADDAAAMKQNIPVLSGKRIQAAIAEPNPCGRINIRHMRPVAVAAVIAFILLCSVLFMARRQYDKPETGTDEAVGGIVNLAGQGPLSPLAALLEKPLTDELNNIIGDTESAIRFLVARVAVNVNDTEDELMK